MSAVRHKVWDRWGELTRFRFACEMSLNAYQSYVDGFPLKEAESLTISDPGGAKFECSYPDFRAALCNREQLYRVMLPAYMGLVEELGREVVVELINDKAVPRTAFPNLDREEDLSEAVSLWISKTGIEVWGAAIVAISHRKFPKVKERRRSLVEASVARNLCVHGLTVFNDSSISRMTDAGDKGGPCPKPGERFTLDQQTFLAHVDSLTGFARLIAGVAKSLKPGLVVAPRKK